MPVNHYWMPTMLLSKVVAGLGLPSRPTALARPTGAARVPRSPKLGDDVDDALDEGDVALSNGAWADDYALELAAGQSIAIDTTGGASLTETCCSLDVEAQLLLDGELLARDDDGAGVFDSRLELTAKRKGTYVLRVTTSGSGDKRGPYRVHVGARRCRLSLPTGAARSRRRGQAKRASERASRYD